VKRTFNFLPAKSSTLVLCVFVLLQGFSLSQAKFLNPKDAKVRPKGRIASYATATIGIVFLSPEELGQHRYRYSLWERNGIVYTCRAGHIDITHLRKFADWTGFFAAKILGHLEQNTTQFSFRMREPSLYRVQLTYPQDWTELSDSDRDRIAREVSIGLGQYVAYTASIWHEILTWFGFKYAGFYPEYPSAFSWEDSFSNLLGCHIGAQALRDGEHEFDEAATLAIDRELEKLDVQSGRTARRAAAAMRGKWYTGDLMFVDIKARNLDVGLNDGFVTPWIVPSISVCEGVEVQPYPVPKIDFLSKYGFSLKLEIEPKEWEKGQILQIIYPDANEKKGRLEPAIHFAPIIDYIEEDVINKYGHVNPYYTDSNRLSRSRSSWHEARLWAYGGDSPGEHIELTEAVQPGACPRPVLGDINGDCRVDRNDLQILAMHWLRNRQNADLVPLN